MEDHEIEIAIRDTNNNVLKIEKVPARSARVTIYVQVGNPAQRALDETTLCPECGVEQIVTHLPTCAHYVPSRQ